MKFKATFASLVLAGLALSAGDASAQPHRAGPLYLYPDPATTPGVVNPDITQGNIGETICNPNWSTKSIRPPVSYTNHLKVQQLVASKFKDKMPSHYEEDHLISLELGGNPLDPKNLWPEMWGTPGTPLTSTRPVSSTPRRRQGEGRSRESTPQGSVRRDADAARGAAHYRDGLVPLLPGPRVHGLDEGHAHAAP